jgi:hypothetical protein
VSFSPFLFSILIANPLLYPSFLLSSITSPDAKYWLPSFPNSPHACFWATFKPSRAFYVGGFGDTHYIGWLDIEKWRE